jgi:hypothetical protein
MRPITLLAFAATAFLPLAAAAATPAAPTGVAEDARCLMIMGTLTGSKDQGAAATGQLGIAYYAGRIKAREPSYDLGVRLPAVASTLNGQNIQAEGERCAAAVVGMMRELQTAQKSFAPPPAAGAPGAAPAAKPPSK